MPSLKQIGTICFLSILLISPTFADDEPTTPTLIPTPAGCNNSVLNTTTGPAALEAIYTANTIGTTWYSDGVQITGAGVPNTCTYNTTMTLPSNPTKPGYAFNGWTLRVPPFDLTTLDPTIHATSVQYKAISDGIASQYNRYTPLTSSGATAAGLNNGEWLANFSYGTIYGRAYCSDIWGSSTDQGYYVTNRYYHHIVDSDGDPYWPTGRSDEWRFTNAQVMVERGDSCLCQITGIVQQGGEQQNVALTDWLYWTGDGGYEGVNNMCTEAYYNNPSTRNAEAEKECNILSCEDECAYLCAYETISSSSYDYRNTYLPALFGITQ